MWRGARGLCLALVAASACKPGAKKSAPPPPPPRVLVAPVGQRDVPVERVYVGTLAGYVDVDIRARVEGFLLGQHYEEGSFVDKDQLLFQIDPAPFIAALRDAEGSLARAQAEQQRSSVLVKRLKPLAKKLAVSQQDLDNALAAQSQAVAAVQSAEALVKQAQLNLSYTNVISPIAGLAGAAQVRLGNLVGTPGSPTLLTTVSQIEPTRAIFPITEVDYLALAQQGEDLNRSRSVTLELTNGTRYPEAGKLTFADRQINPSTGTLLMEALFPNPESILRPGQSVRVHVVFETIEGALTVQQRAISELQGLKRVTVVGDDDIAHQVTVETGPQVGTDIVVVGPLQPGQQVVVEGVDKAKDGSQVQPRPAPPLPKGGPPPASAPGASGAPGPGR
ncbi:MAG TPA: efflux RND transporter periplasmic adaptor subunit [Vulgatibacter sp.]